MQTKPLSDVEALLGRQVVVTHHLQVQLATAQERIAELEKQLAQIQSVPADAAKN